MEYLFDEAAQLQLIADGLTADDPRFARRISAGPMGLWRTLRRATGTVVLAATSVAVTGLALGSVTTVALGLSFVFLGLLLTAGITVQLRIGNRTARRALGLPEPVRRIQGALAGLRHRLIVARFRLRLRRR